jgi:hypothetical protein
MCGNFLAQVSGWSRGGPAALKSSARPLNPENRVMRCDVIELIERCILVHGKVRPCPRSDSEVGLENWGAELDRHLDEHDILRPPVPQSSFPVGGSNVPNPGVIFPQHGDQVPVITGDYHCERQGDSSARTTPDYFESDHSIGSDTQ